MRGSKTFCHDCFLLLLFFAFLDGEGRMEPKTTKRGPSSAHWQNAIMAFCWRAYDGPTLNTGLVVL